MQAHRLAPEVVRPLGVIVDAQVELGRYDDAARTLQRMVDLKPNLASYARVSYFRELHGDLGGALSAMRLAVSAGGAAPENVAYVQTLLGTLQYTRGNLVAARAAYDEALASFPGYPPAHAGVARVDAAQGHLARAISGYREVVDRLPLPEYAIALGEAEEASGQRAAARRDYQLVDVEQKLLAQAGVNTDTELAVFDADHGDPAQAVVLARRAWANAPSVRSADALGWSLTRAGPAGGGTRLGSPRAEARLARSGLPLPRGDGRARGRRAAARAHVADAGAGPEPALLPAARAAGAGGTAMKRLVLALALAFVLFPGAASAHPLGNFSVNHEAVVQIDSQQVKVTWLLDQAEIPTFRERGLPPATVLARKRADALGGLRLIVDGRPVALRPAPGAAISFPPGQGGLKLTRVVLPLVASVDDPREVDLRDGTYPGRVGWRAVVARRGDGTAVRSTAPGGDPTNGLRRYPKDALKTPVDIRTAHFAVHPGNGTLTAPRAPGGDYVEQGGKGDGGFAGLFADAASGQGVLALLLLAALGWGALHALSPGHGKAMVAAYLVGTRGRPRHAVALGATVTVTHTIGVFALGLVTLALSQYVLPEDLYPWLTLASALLVLVVGAGVLRQRLKARKAHHHHHHHHHEHDLSWRGVLAMGAAAGLLPCPSALVVLLAAISQHQVALGLLLIVAFSLGLALTLTTLGLMVVWAQSVPIPARAMSVLPTASALMIVGVGIVLTLKSLPGVT